MFFPSRHLLAYRTLHFMLHLPPYSAVLRLLPKPALATPSVSCHHIDLPHKNVADDVRRTDELTSSRSAYPPCCAVPTDSNS
eukprot:scaffold22459_cov54-Attheya_sp.AAC.6